MSRTLNGRCWQRSLAVSVILCAAIGAPAADLDPRYVAQKPQETRLWPGLRDDLIVVKFVEGSRVRARDGRLVSLANLDLADANRILIDKPQLQTRRLFTRSEVGLERDRAQAQLRSGHEMADLNNYYQVVLADGGVEAAETLIDELNALPIVEIAYAEPIPEVALLDREQRVPGATGRRPMPRRDVVAPSSGASPGLAPGTRHGGMRALGGTPNFEPLQEYLGPAPTGVDAYAAWTYTGGRGETVKVIDIELGWNWSHEDMKAPFFQGGEITYSDHGIAVVGEIMAQDNGYGTTGIANEVEIGGYSVYNIPTAEAFDQSAAVLDAGDIYVIELHCPGPTGQFIALEWWQANFDVISMHTARGVICVAAAGNGSADFDSPVYESRFDRNVRDSGAIIVGATNGASLDPASFTNHGSRVDLAGWGFDVVTTGYGNLQGGPVNEWYTGSFSGTSSATPIVVGTVAAMQGIYKAQSGGVALAGGTIAQLLKETGTPTNGPQLIGPRPNLALAVPAMLDDLAAINGTVTESDSVTPIEGVEMRIVETGTRTMTAADGTYDLPITAGGWTVRATKFGYDTNETVVGAASPNATHDVALDLTPAVDLSGVVVDESGQGIAGAQVLLPDTPLPAAIAGSDGSYVIAGVPVTHGGTVVASAGGLTPDERLALTDGSLVDLRLALPDDFEANNGGLSGTGQWQWGIPNFVEGPSSAHSGQRCWGTNLTGHYNFSQDHFLTTSSFDLAGLIDPRLAYWQWYSIWGTYDGINVEISTNGGATWQVLDPVGGYPDSCINGLPGSPCEPGWTGVTHAWVPAVFELSAFAGESVQFRFTLGTYGFTGSPGWYIDDLRVHGGAVTNETVAVDSFAVTFGRLVGGNVASLRFSDDDNVETEQRAPVSVLLPNIRLELLGHADVVMTPSRIVHTFEASASALPPTVPQRLEMFAYDGSGWEIIDERTATTTQSVVELEFTGNPQRYLDNEGRIAVRAGWFHPGDVLFVNWGASIDQAIWTLEP